VILKRAFDPVVDANTLPLAEKAAIRAVLGTLTGRR